MIRAPNLLNPTTSNPSPVNYKSHRKLPLFSASNPSFPPFLRVHYSSSSPMYVFRNFPFIPSLSSYYVQYKNPSLILKTLSSRSLKDLGPKTEAFHILHKLWLNQKRKIYAMRHECCEGMVKARPSTTSSLQNLQVSQTQQCS